MSSDSLTTYKGKSKETWLLKGSVYYFLEEFEKIVSNSSTLWEREMSLG